MGGGVVVYIKNINSCFEIQKNELDDTVENTWIERNGEENIKPPLIMFIIACQTM